MPLRMRHLAKSRTQVFISSLTVRVRVTVRFNNSHLSRKSRTASYLAMRHIWHDTGAATAQRNDEIVEFRNVRRQCDVSGDSLLMF